MLLLQVKEQALEACNNAKMHPVKISEKLECKKRFCFVGLKSCLVLKHLCREQQI
jgi:hypothetical protein